MLGTLTLGLVRCPCDTPARWPASRLKMPAEVERPTVGPRAGDGPLSVRVHPSVVKGATRRYAMTCGHPGQRRPLWTLCWRKGWGGTSPSRTQAIPFNAEVVMTNETTDDWAEVDDAYSKWLERQSFNPGEDLCPLCGTKVCHHCAGDGETE